MGSLKPDFLNRLFEGIDFDMESSQITQLSSDKISKIVEDSISKRDFLKEFSITDRFKFDKNGELDEKTCVQALFDCNQGELKSISKYHIPLLKIVLDKIEPVHLENESNRKKILDVLKDVDDLEIWPKITVHTSKGKKECHRLLLMVRSPVFRNMVKYDGKIVINEDSTPLFNLFYEWLLSQFFEEVTQLDTLCDLLAFADRYDLAQFKN